MEIVDLPGNSRNRRKPEQEPEEDKKIEKVVSGEVQRKKPGLRKRFKVVFFPADASSVGQYVVFDVLIPALKDMIVDAGQEALRRMILGESRSSSYRPSKPSSQQGYVSYNRYGSPPSKPPWKREREERPRLSREARANHVFDDILLATRREGELVIDRMYDLIERYEQVSVGDLYELLGLESDFTDQKWGWLDLQGANVRHTRDGYSLDLPKPEQLD